MLIGAFQGKASGYTLDNIRLLFNHPYIDAYKTSIEISLVTALIGGVVGLFIAYAAIREGTPRWIRSVLTTFSGVAANFGGIPLAFAFIATLGPLGIVTVLLRNHGCDFTAARLPALLEDRRRARVHVLPAAADDPRHRARDRRAAQGVARGVVEPRREAVAVLALRRPARC